MPILSLRLSDAEFNQITTSALEKSMTTNEYAKSVLFPHNTVSANTLCHNVILQRIKEKYKTGDTFSIPDLFTQEEWQNFTNTVSIGRTFRILSKQESSCVHNAVSFVEKKSGYPAVYKVK